MIQAVGGHDLWYSGKHKAHGGNIQVLTDPCGFPVWTSPVQPGSVHDIAAARTHGVLGALYPVADAGMPTLANKGYTGTGIGIRCRPRASTSPRTTRPATCCSTSHGHQPSAPTHC